MAIIGEIGTAGGTGHVIEFAGEAIQALSMEGRMTVCNMALKQVPTGMIAPDEDLCLFARTSHVTKGEMMDEAIAWWKTLPSDEGAHDKEGGVKGRRYHPNSHGAQALKMRWLLMGPFQTQLKLAIQL